MSPRTVLTDEQWALIEPLMPATEGKRGRPFRDHRQVVEGIIYRYRAGVTWRDVPEEFGPYQTVWKRHRRFAGDGTWDKVLEVLLGHAETAGIVDWEVSVDSTIVRAHQHGTSLTRDTVGSVESQESPHRAA